MAFPSQMMLINTSTSDKDINHSLVSSSSIMGETDEEQIQRLDVPYKNLSSKYLLGIEKNSSRQYFEMYSARLEIMRPKIEKVALEKWGNIQIKRLHELETDHSEDCIIVGTLFKKQDLKPSILKELAEENQLMPQPILEKYTSEDDEIILEDELQRIQLKGNINTQELVTGIICGVKGYDDSGGKFHVNDICFVGLPQPQPKDMVPDDKFVLFISGVDLHSERDSLLPLQLMVDYVTGHLAELTEQRNVSNIGRVVIAGNSICGSKKDISVHEKVKLTKVFDDLLTQISSVCPVDVMPGEFDPANQIMPQQPLHHCLFPEAFKCSLMQCVTNPYEFELGGRRILGTSGQNVMDIGRCSSLSDPIEILENLCRWGHVAPSAPDTLLSYPYHEKEPFIVDSRPDIVFAGNQHSLKFKLINETRSSLLLLSVPKFSTTRTCALVNLRTLEAQPLIFDVGCE